MGFAYAATVFAGIFLILLVLLHFLKPELDPAWRMISEYEIGRHGWMMRLAFFCWGLSVASLLFVIWLFSGSPSGIIGRWWLVVISLALFGAGIFITNAITDDTPSTANTLHTLCGTFVILTFPVAATIIRGSLLQNSSWLAARGHLTFGTLLAWLGMVAFFASILISRRLDPSAGRVGPHVYLGWPNRFMVFTYVLWLMLVAYNAILIV